MIGATINAIKSCNTDNISFQGKLPFIIMAFSFPTSLHNFKKTFYRSTGFICQVLYVSRETITAIKKALVYRK